MNNLEELSEEMHKKPKLEDILFRISLLVEDSDADEIQSVIRRIMKLGAVEKETALKSLRKQTKRTLETLKKAIEEEGGSDRPDHYFISQAVIDKLGRENILATTAHIWHWDGTGVWNPLADGIAIWNLVQPVLVVLKERVKHNFVKSVAEVIKTTIYVQNAEWNTDPDLINFKNGELRYRKGKWKLGSHNRNSRLTTQIPHEYDPEAKAPLFQKFLNEIFEGEEDADEKITLILEMIGYSLASHARYEAFILLIGKGGNGKSVLLHILAFIVGKKNIAAVAPSKFSVSSDRAHLHNKLVNLVTEMPEGVKIADAELKSVTSGELVTASNKYGHPFEFSPFITNWFAANHMPYTSDHSDGLYRRAFIVWFNKKFERGKNADPKLKEKLEKEVRGIIALALDAYGKVIEREGKFTEPKSSKAAKDDWKYEVNQVEQFVDEMCIRDPNARTASAAVFLLYKGYADEMGFKRLNHNNFTRRLKMSGFSTVRTGKERMISGLRLIDQDDESGIFG